MLPLRTLFWEKLSTTVLKTIGVFAKTINLDQNRKSVVVIASEAKQSLDIWDCFVPLTMN